MKRFILILLIQFGAYVAYPQGFDWNAGLKSVQKDGFYNIPLMPPIISKLNNNFTDIRIYDKNGKEVPYLLRKETPSKQISSFTEYEILGKLYKPGKSTEILLHNPENKPINNISLIIKNADVNKEAKLVGSYDQKTWFTVKDYHQFHSINNTSSTAEIKILDFPLVNYKYLKLWINDSLSAPINILKAGYYVHFTESTEYAEVQTPLISQLDSAREKTSYITVSFPELQYVDKLELQLKGPNYYLRQGTAEVKDTLENGKTYYRYLQNFEISSHKPHVLSFENEKIKELRIIIKNEDNPPLQIIAAQAWQQKHFLTAFLEKNNKYTLQFGNPKATAPAYDLHYFQDSIAKNIPLASVNEIIRQSKPKVPARIEPSSLSKKLAIWSGIGGVILLLGFISIKMIREMSSEK